MAGRKGFIGFHPGKALGDAIKQEIADDSRSTHQAWFLRLCLDHLGKKDPAMVERIAADPSFPWRTFNRPNARGPKKGQKHRYTLEVNKWQEQQ